MENIELQHAGTKGMKWGRRLYQNKDGSLTPLGRMRYNKAQADRIKKAQATRAANKSAAEKRAEDLKKGRIKLKDMTDDEIKARIDRLELEKKLKDLEHDTAITTKGKRFIDKFSNATVDKIAENVGADLIAQALKSVASDAINSKVFNGTDRVFDNNKRK